MLVHVVVFVFQFYYVTWVIKNTTLTSTNFSTRNPLVHPFGSFWPCFPKLCVYLRVFVCARVYVCLYVLVCLCVCMCSCVCVFVCARVSVCLYVLVCMYTRSDCIFFLVYWRKYIFPNLDIQKFSHFCSMAL